MIDGTANSPAGAGSADESDDSLPPTPVNHNEAAKSEPGMSATELAEALDAPTKETFSPTSPGHKAFMEEKAKRMSAQAFQPESPESSPAALAPMMTARTQENIDKLEDLAAFAEGLSPTSSEAVERMVSPEKGMMFTARDFVHTELDPMQAVQIAEAASKQRAAALVELKDMPDGPEKDALVNMSPEDRAAVRAAWTDEHDHLI